MRKAALSDLSRLQRWAGRPIVRLANGLYPLWHWAMRTAASSDVSRGAIGRARRTDPPSGGLFHVWARIPAGSNAAPYNLHGPVRIPDEFPTVRALGRAAAAVLLLPAVLRRGGAGQGRRPDTTREFESVSRVADVLSRTGDVEGAARALLDELAELFDLGFAALTFVSDDARHASGYLARVGGQDLDWWRDMRLDLDREPSGIASAVFEATAITVYDTASSGVVSRRLADAVGAKSAAFIPLLVEDRVTAVVPVAPLDGPRVFSSEDLAVMQTLAAEAAVALERLRGGVALEEALKRNEEQLAQQTALLRAAHVLSSELDLPVVLQRLADQLAQLLDADAADCYLLDGERGLFRCVAVHGFDRALLGFEFPMGQGLAGAAVREGRPLIDSGDRAVERKPRGGGGVRTSGRPSRDPRRAGLGQPEPAFPRGRGGAHPRLFLDRRRRASAARPPRRRSGEPLPLAHLGARGRTPRRRAWPRAHLLHGGALVQRRRPRARAPPRRRHPRGPRAERAVRGRARRPRARPAADPHGPAADERARSRGGARRGRAAGPRPRQR